MNRTSTQLRVCSCRGGSVLIYMSAHAFADVHVWQLDFVCFAMWDVKKWSHGDNNVHVHWNGRKHLSLLLSGFTCTFSYRHGFYQEREWNRKPEFKICLRFLLYPLNYFPWERKKSTASRPEKRILSLVSPKVARFRNCCYIYCHLWQNFTVCLSVGPSLSFSIYMPRWGFKLWSVFGLSE